MNYRACVAIVVLVAASTSGCGRREADKPAEAEPAKVAHHVEEQSLNTVELTPKAEQRLGIQLAETQFVQVQRRRTVGGEVVIPPGQTIIVSTPIAGTLAAPENAAPAAPGAEVTAGQPMFSFTPLLTPERDVLTPAERVRVAQTKADVATAQIEAERQVESAKIAVEAAQIAYDRAVRLLESKAGSQRSVDEAEAQWKLAGEALTTAEARYRLLSGIELDEQAGELATRSIESPVTGVLQSVEAAAGETVTAGDVLFSVVRTDPVWVRVPVYVGHWREVDMATPASISEYGQQPDVAPRSAKYVSAPPSANAVATTVDLFYELANPDGRLYPGQRLAVTLPMQGNEQSLVVPFRAVLYDIDGGAWVYQQLEQHVYARHRVAVRYVDTATAILAAGPPAGTKVVTDGAVELFGTEFGVGH
ncbi:MAG: efflux RND transporter periplasmic adaptor subunit [Pirellulales bacterium]|nr:efflux RND transporter periplasmic adaptor subunit [Pirellulales bacterium]